MLYYRECHPHPEALIGYNSSETAEIEPILPKEAQFQAERLKEVAVRRKTSFL